MPQVGIPFGNGMVKPISAVDVWPEVFYIRKYIMFGNRGPSNRVNHIPCNSSVSDWLYPTFDENPEQPHPQPQAEPPIYITLAVLALGGIPKF